MLDLGDITFRRLRCWWLGIESTLNLQLGARFWRVCFVIRGHMLYVSRRHNYGQFNQYITITIVLVCELFLKLCAKFVAKFWANSFSLSLTNSYISMWTGVDTIPYKTRTNRLCELLFLNVLFLRRFAHSSALRPEIELMSASDSSQMFRSSSF